MFYRQPQRVNALYLLNKWNESINLLTCSTDTHYIYDKFREMPLLKLATTTFSAFWICQLHILSWKTVTYTFYIIMHILYYTQQLECCKKLLLPVLTLSLLHQVMPYQPFALHTQGISTYIHSQYIFKILLYVSINYLFVSFLLDYLVYYPFIICILLIHILIYTIYIFLSAHSKRSCHK